MQQKQQEKTFFPAVPGENDECSFKSSTFDSGFSVHLFSLKLEIFKSLKNYHCFTFTNILKLCIWSETPVVSTFIWSCYSDFWTLIINVFLMKCLLFIQRRFLPPFYTEKKKSVMKQVCAAATQSYLPNFLAILFCFIHLNAMQLFSSFYKNYALICSTGTLNYVGRAEILTKITRR